MSKSKNLLFVSANILVEQMQKLQTARGNDLKNEAIRMDSLGRGASALSELADKQIRVLQATGFLPDENVLLDEGEVALVNAKANRLPQIEKKKRPLLDEFIKE